MSKKTEQTKNAIGNAEDPSHEETLLELFHMESWYHPHIHRRPSPSQRCRRPKTVMVFAIVAATGTIGLRRPDKLIAELMDGRLGFVDLVVEVSTSATRFLHQRNPGRNRLQRHERLWRKTEGGSNIALVFW